MATTPTPAPTPLPTTATITWERGTDKAKVTIPEAVLKVLDAQVASETVPKRDADGKIVYDSSTGQLEMVPKYYSVGNLIFEFCMSQLVAPTLARFKPAAVIAAETNLNAAQAAVEQAKMQVMSGIQVTVISPQ